jgi:arylformamidase
MSPNLKIEQTLRDRLVLLSGRAYASGQRRANRPFAVGRSELLPYDVRGKAVLVHTGWDRHWRIDAYFDGHPYLTVDAAAHLLAEAAVLVGIDSLNIDDIRDGERPAHSILLDAGIPICEHLTGLDRLPSSGFRFSAVPVKIRATGTFPVPAYSALA